ncbi:hypothetical protein KP77_04340 [Jeotgalibacillus alimentarius]|uniref:Uncharacterized protein n=1 Tax=Jeotgalibacillus alimentarius TaxID=135826 RepID=A0A0C2WBN8_9BACL|nr:hypothetical protein [Jeotgalibacillus alimentarius]KIL53458.1 hypothetical protein KP77_04340 [Jeotgalibacillus alimentarius]
MKKYAVFILSLAVLYISYQIISGLVLTALYVPDLSMSSISTGGEVALGGSPAIHFLAILLIATIAYFLSQKMIKSA